MDAAGLHKIGVGVNELCESFHVVIARGAAQVAYEVCAVELRAGESITCGAR